MDADPGREALQRRSSEIARQARGEVLAVLSPAQRKDVEALDGYVGLGLHLAVALLRIPDLSAEQQKQLSALAVETLRRKVNLFYEQDLASAEQERQVARRDYSGLEAETRSRVLLLLAPGQAELLRRELAANQPTPSK